MFCFYTLPLARTAQGKIQTLTTLWRVVRSNLLSLIKFSRLYLLITQIEESVGIVKLPNVTSEQEWKQKAKTLKERREKKCILLSKNNQGSFNNYVKKKK